MIQYYLDLEKQVKNIKDSDLSFGQIQKIYSTAFYISFSIRARGKTWHIYFGRGSGNEGVWLHTSPPPSILRRKDNFLEYLRRHLTSCSFSSLEIDESDRIVKINYLKFGQLQSFLFFWRGRKLYFAHYFMDSAESPFKLLLSWKGKAFTPSHDLQDLFEYFDEVGRQKEMSHDLQTSELKDMKTLLDEELKQSNITTATKSNFLERKKKNIEEDLRKAQQWQKLQRLLDKSEPLENVYELKVDDQKIKFEGELNPYERRNLVFQKIKKLKRGENILSERLRSVEEQLSGKNSEPTQTPTIPIIKPIWGEEKLGSKITPPVIEKNEYKIFTMDDLQFGVGLNSHGNDQLRNKWAGKEDIWVHLDGQKSTHVIVKVPSNKTLNADMLNIAATIVAHFSHFNDSWVPIIYTAVKNLKGVSGTAGMVIYKKEKHLRCQKVHLDQWLKE